MPLKRMQRLGPMLAAEGMDHEGSTVSWDVARFVARFGHDQQGLVTIRLQVEAELPLICQRSLAPYVEKVRRQSLLTVIESITEQDEIPESYDPVLVEHKRMALLDIVEEELLLAVPQVPRNPEIGEVELSTDGVVTAPAVAEKEKRHQPFAGLAGLMKANRED
jgi:uncharacterized protein